MPIIHLFAASVNFTICAVRAMMVTVMKMTDKKIKLIALDLDDTTLRSDASLAPETAQTIANAVKSGTQVVIASGRAFKSLPQSVLQIDGIRYAICSNGACIEDMHSRTRLLSFTLRPQVVEQLLETFSGERFEAFIDGQPYCDGEYYREPSRFGCSPAYLDYVKTTRILVKKHFGVRTKCSGRMECRNLFLICFPVRKLCLDFLNGAVAPVREPRGKLFGTVFAEIPVF